MSDLDLMSYLDLMSDLYYVFYDIDLKHPKNQYLCKQHCISLEGIILITASIIRSETKELGDWLDTAFSYIGNLPRYLVPSYFYSVLAR